MKVDLKQKSDLQVTDAEKNIVPLMCLSNGALMRVKTETLETLRIKAQLHVKTNRELEMLI